MQSSSLFAGAFGAVPRRSERGSRASWRKCDEEHDWGWSYSLREGFPVSGIPHRLHWVCLPVLMEILTLLFVAFIGRLHQCHRQYLGHWLLYRGIPGWFGMCLSSHHDSRICPVSTEGWVTHGWEVTEFQEIVPSWVCSLRLMFQHFQLFLLEALNSQIITFTFSWISPDCCWWFSPGKTRTLALA